MEQPPPGRGLHTHDPCPACLGKVAGRADLLAANAKLLEALEGLAGEFKRRMDGIIEWSPGEIVDGVLQSEDWEPDESVALESALTTIKAAKGDA